MIQHLRAADVLLLPIRDTVLNRSRSPNKLFQYIAVRRPIVTNRLENIYEAVGDDALYFDFASDEDFVRRIGEALGAGAPVPSVATVARSSWETRYATYLGIIGGVRSPTSRPRVGPAGR